MSEDVLILSETVGDATITTTLHPEGDRWISSVRGGALDGYTSVMDRRGVMDELHNQVIETVKQGGPPAP